MSAPTLSPCAGCKKLTPPGALYADPNGRELCYPCFESQVDDGWTIGHSDRFAEAGLLGDMRDGPDEPDGGSYSAQCPICDVGQTITGTWDGFACANECADPEAILAALRAPPAPWLTGTPVDPLAEPPEPLPAVPGIPFAYAGASVLATGPTGSGRSSLIEAMLYDATRAGLRAAYASGEVTEGECHARAADLADRRGDPVGDELRRQLTRLRWLDLASVIERAWQDRQAWADGMARLYAIVAIDPLSTVASTLGLDFDKSNAEFVDYHDRLIKPLTDRGVVVLRIGHAIEAKARAKGASAKADKADVVLTCALRAGPALAIRATKVRSVRAPFRRGDVWRFDRDTQRIHRDTEHESDAAPTFRPTVLMQRVSEAIEADPGLTRRALRTAVKGSRHDAKELALELLIAERYVEQRQNGKWPTHHSLRPFREADDTGPQVAPDWPPGPVVATGPTGPPPLGGQGPGATPNGSTAPAPAPDDLDRAERLLADHRDLNEAA